MCGRFTLRTPLKEVAQAFNLPAAALQPARQWQLRFNIAPTQPVAAVRAVDGERELVDLQWGLVPSWAEGPGGPPLINARAETLATKPAFRESFRRRRCLILSDGFYEWRQASQPKQPFYVRLKQDGPFAFAGLWDRWRHGELAIESCTIVTTEANELLNPIFNRMPVILGAEDIATWLDPQIGQPEPLEPLLRPYPSELMTCYPVGSVINNARNDRPQCIEPQPLLKTQGSLFET